MAAIDQIVSVSISTDSQVASRVGFGTPLIAAYHTKNTDVIREYSDPSELIDDGFTVNDWLYKQAAIMWQQTPHPPKFKVGRRTLPFTQLIDLYPVNTTEGYVYTIVLTDESGTESTITYTVLAAATVATICTALQALLNAVTGLTATDDTTHVSCAAAAGKLFNYDIGTDTDPKDDLVVEDITADPGIATDLASFLAADPTGWYCALLDSNSPAEVAAAAAWVETNKKIGSFNATDGEIIDSAVSNDLFSTLQGLSYKRTHLLFSQSQVLSYSGSAIAARMLPTDPGTSTWAHQELIGVRKTDNIKSAYKTQIENKGGNWYAEIAGLGTSFQGASPQGEYLDTTRFVDFLEARIQEDVFSALNNRDKIPFTDQGVQIIVGIIQGRLDSNVSTEKRPRGLSSSPAPQVFFPAVSDIDTADKAGRNLPDITFSAKLAGAIHTVVIKGKVSV